MKKIDWFIPLFFMAIGLICLTISASYYQTDALTSGLSMIRTSCIWIAIIGIIIYFIYRFIRFKKGDCILISVILLVAAIMYGINAFQASSAEISPGEAYAQIQVDGEITKKVKLTKETQWIEIKTDRGYDLLRIRDFGIEVVESDCPEKICYTFGHIKKSNEVIVCLPLRMYITIISDTPSDADEVDAII